LLEPQYLQEISDDGSFVCFHVFGGESRNGGARFIVKARAVQADEETGVAIHLYNAFDTAPVEIDVLPGWAGT